MTTSKSIAIPCGVETVPNGIPKSASFKSPANLKFNTRVPIEDRPCVPNKSQSKGPS